MTTPKPTTPQDDHRQHGPRKIGDGIPGFRTSFGVSGKGGGAFRPIGDNFTVNPANGTLYLAIPIPTSPTRGEFGPKLKLSYDSGSGNGPWGFGWGLGLPSIRRKTARGIPRYLDSHDDNDDDLILLNDDIVPCVNSNGALDVRTDVSSDWTVVRYRPRIETHALRIEKWIRIASGGEDVHWRTINADNVTSLYGYDDSSRIFDSSGGRRRTVSWLLSRTYDSWGNAIEYTYKQEDGLGLVGPGQSLPLWETNRSEESRCRQKYLKRIRYGNRSANRDLETWEVSAAWPDDWMFEVVFDYGEHSLGGPSTAESGVWKARHDPFSVGNIGFELRTYRLCHRILMFHHFPTAQKVPEILVSSTSFTYNQSPQGSFLSGLVVNGHGTGDDEHATESLPPWSFQYSTAPNPSQVGALGAEVANLVDIMPRAGASPSAEWIDLDGEGIPGLLTRLRDGTMLYQRNGGAGSSPNGGLQLSVPRLLDQQPSLGQGGLGEFRDLDKSGRLNLVSLDPHDRQPRAFYERDSSDTWSEYSDMTDISVTDPDLERNAMKIDITGDGTTDLLCGEGEGRDVIWRQSLGKKGMSGYNSTPSRSSSRCDSNRLPRLAQNPSITPNAQAFAADMTGDGLADVVEVSANKITYWPNHGHGDFGPVVEMGNSPALVECEDGSFTIDRVRLVDVDGSGTTDLIHLLLGGGAHLYYNQAGNSWSNPVFVPNVPKIVSPSSVFTLDILGRGTACLCWVDTSNLSGSTQVRYLDLMGGVKPHLLCQYENGLGAAREVSYTPSTKYRLDDEARGQPWTRTLPFPVQCVSRVHAKDYITANSMTTDYVYHDGYYDPVEKHFAGFEMVEEWVRETTTLGEGETYESPETQVTKSWFSVGDGLSVDSTRFFAPSLVSSAVHQPAGEDPAPAHRTLRGSRIRVEVLGRDGTDKEDNPYTVQEFSYDIKQLQPPSSISKFAVYRVSSRATAHSQYDRLADDPRVTHKAVLRSNDWGDAEASLDIVYPRATEHAVIAAGEYDDVKLDQLAGSMLLTEISYTNVVDEAHCLRKPVVWQSLDYEVRKFPFHGVINVDQIRGVDFAVLPEKESGSGTWKALRSGERSYFTKADLSGPLPWGKLQSFSILDRSFTLAFTPAILLEVQQGLRSNGVSNFFDDAAIMREGGFINLDGDGNWWAPSDSASFESTPGSSTLQTAKKTFYTPTVFTDAFGNRTFLELDTDSLLAGSTTDAVGQSVSFVNDYRHLQPIEITDENLNTQRVSIDSLGRTTAVAVQGKGSDPDGDSLEGEVAARPGDVVAALDHYSHDIGKQILGNAGSRVFLCLDRFVQWKSQQARHQPMAMGTAAPACIVEISRDVSFRKSDNPTIRIAVTYLGGSGQVIQKMCLADSKDQAKSWVVQHISATSISGKTLRTLQPFFVSSPSFIPLPQLVATNATTSFYDALCRNIGRLHPDHTWSKTVVTPWAVSEHDAGSTVLCPNPQDDLDIGLYFSRIKSSRFLPTWHEATKKNENDPTRVAATKAEVYQDSPTVTHYGARGLVIRWVLRAGTTTYTGAFSYDYSGNKIRETDGLGRVVETKVYDLRGHPICSSGMDTGESWELRDVHGKDLVAWNNRGIGSRRVYDALRREVQRWTYGDGEGQAKLSVETTYGEACPGATDRNLVGKVWKVKDQSGAHENMSFDIRGRCTSRTFQPADNYKGDLDWQAAPSLMDIVFSYQASFDNFDQLLEEQDAQGNKIRRLFSPLGHVQRVSFHKTDGQGIGPIYSSTTFTGDGLPLLTQRGNEFETEYLYDAASRWLLSRKTLRGTGEETEILEDLNFAYDCCGRLVHVVDASEQKTLLDTSDVKTEWDYSYDIAGQLVAAKGKAQGPAAPGKQLRAHRAETQEGGTSTAVNRLYTYHEAYAYDLAGNITHMSHMPVNDESLSGWTRSYRYEEQTFLRGGANTRNNQLSTTLVRSTQQPDPTAPADNKEKADPSQEEQEETYSYDDNNDAKRAGLMTALAPSTNLTWDARNQLATSSRTTDDDHETTYYVYDHAGRRVRKVTADPTGTRKTRDTFYLDGVELCTAGLQHPRNEPPSTSTGGAAVGGAEQTAVKRWTARVDGLGYVETTAAAAAGGPAGEGAGVVAVRYRVADGDHSWKGSSMELDERGQVVLREEYSPFGAVVARWGARGGGTNDQGRDGEVAGRGYIRADGGYGFAQYRWDGEAGLYYCARTARYYSPWLGRWVSPGDGGDRDGSGNVYRYGQNDPVNVAGLGGA
jgi:RHS repeat-associated protein